MPKPKLKTKPLPFPPNQCVISKRADLPVIDFGIDIVGMDPHLYVGCDHVRKAAKVLKMVDGDKHDELKRELRAKQDRIAELQAQLAVKPLVDDGMAEKGIRDFSYELSAAVCAIFMRENPDVEMPAEAVTAVIDEALASLSNEPATAPEQEVKA